MALTYGFYNSINHDRRYNALQMSSLFDGIITDGIFMNIGTAMVVTAGNGTTVNVGIGRAWFNSTWTLNDAIYPIDVGESDVLRDRIDAIVLEVNQNDNARANRIFVLNGTPASSPTKPTLQNSSGIYQHPLAYIYRTAESTVVTQANIENCVGTSECPFVTGILSTISTDELIKQWTSRFEALISKKTNDFDTLLTELRASISEVFEGQIPDSVIYGEVTDDTASAIPIDADYLNGIPANKYALLTDVDQRVYMKLLWMNPSPSIQFGAQTIELDLSSYDAVLISHCKVDRLGVPRVYGLVKKGTTGEILYCVEVNAYRTVIVNDTGVRFEPSYYYRVYASTTATVGNQFCVPIEIYGIKGVQ